MDCERFLSLLSAYIDGEVHGQEAERLEQHLAVCESCARELEALRRTTALLSANAEVEPPDFLLERIEAATVGRKGIFERVRARLERVPRYVQIAGASLAAAGLLAFVILTQPRNDHVARPVEVKPGLRQPTVVVTPSSTESESPRVQPYAKHVHKSGSSERVRRHTRPVLVASSQKSLSVKEARRTRTTAPSTLETSVKEKSETAGEEALTEAPETQPGTESEEKAEPAAVALVPDSSQPVEKKAGVVPERFVPQEDPSAIEQLRAKLAAKNKQRYEVKEDPVVGKKHTVTLVGFRF